MKKKIIAFILCICLISSFCLQPAYAMGAEGAIIGGGAAAAGISLTMPQVAILVAAGFGLVYAVNHADDIANGLNNALENAATNVANGMEELNYWKEQAMKGAIALSTAPAWVATAVKGWISELYNSSNTTFSAVSDYAAGEEFPNVSFWGTATNSFDADVTVLRTGYVEVGETFTDLSCNMTVFSTEIFDSPTPNTKTINGVKYYYKLYTWSTSLHTDNVAAGKVDEFNKKALEQIPMLPDSRIIKEAYPDNTSSKFLYLLAWADGLLTSDNGSVCPDVTIGGISNALGEHSIDNINIPDLDIGGSSIFNGGHSGTFEESFNDTFTGLREKEITWEQYMNDVAVGTPTVSIPATGEATGTLEYPITDTGVSDIPLDTTIPSNPSIPGNPSVEVPEGLAPFTISLSDLFPFCIPFDIADFVNVLCAEPEAPKFEWAFPSPDGNIYKMEIDLSPFDGVAQLLRNMELLLFCIGLALMTRNQIRG